MVWTVDLAVVCHLSYKLDVFSGAPSQHETVYDFIWYYGWNHCIYIRIWAMFPHCGGFSVTQNLGDVPSLRWFLSEPESGRCSLIAVVSQ